MRHYRLLFESHIPHKRTYLVQVNNSISEEHLIQLRGGVPIRTGANSTYFTAPCEIKIITAPETIYPFPSPIKVYPPYTWLLITLTEGKYHQVRKMLGVIHHRCKRLIRVSIEGIDLSNLPAGSTKEMTGEDFFSYLSLQFPV